MTCPCALSRTIRLVAPHALASYAPEFVAAIDAAGLGSPLLPVHLFLEEIYLAPIMTPSERERLKADHGIIRAKLATPAMLEEHGRWEEGVFARIRQSITESLR